MNEVVIKLKEILKSECECHAELLVLAELQGELILKQDGAGLIPVLVKIEDKLKTIVSLEEERRTIEGELEKDDRGHALDAVKELSSTLASLAEVLKKMLIVNRRNALALSAANDYMRFCAGLWAEQSAKGSYPGKSQQDGAPLLIDGRI